MASRWLREVECSEGGTQSGIQHMYNCLAWFFSYMLPGWTVTGTHGPSQDKGSYYAYGSAGEFNLSGADCYFRDLLIDPYYFTMPAMIGKYISIVSSDGRNCGIYKVIGSVDDYTAIIDFRCGSGEYPTQETGLTWAAFSQSPSIGDGVMASKSGYYCNGIECAPLCDGQSANSKIWMFLRNDIPPGWPTPTPKTSTAIPPRRFNPNNTLVGKTLNWTTNGTPHSCTFTGTINPLGINDIIGQLQAAGLPAFRSDGLGWPRADSWFVSYCDSDANWYAAYILVEAGSTAWADLGLNVGGSYLNGQMPWSLSPLFASGTQPPPPATPIPEDSGFVVGAWMAGCVQGWMVAGTVEVAQINFEQIIKGNHAQWARGSCSNNVRIGYGQTVRTGFFTATSPDGWAIQVAMGDPFSGIHLEVYVSPNGIWEGSDAKVTGPVYLGSANGVTNWLYADVDADGKWANFFVHQPTANHYNGIMAGRLEPFETSDPDETVVLLGASGSSSYGCTGNFKRTFVSAKDSLGQGFVWSNMAKQPIVCAMVEPSYVDGVSGLSKWTSRERNSRASGSSLAGGSTGDSLAVAAGVVTLTKTGTPFRATDAGKLIAVSGCANGGNNGIFPVTEYVGPTQIKFTNADGVNETSAFAWTMDAEDAAEGTIIVADVNNASGEYRLVGRMQGHVSCRSGAVSGWANRKAFQAEGAPKFHVNDGIAIAWPTKVTPQH